MMLAPSLFEGVPPEEAAAVKVHDEEVLSLVASAVARRTCPDLGFADTLAEEIAEALALTPDRFDERQLRASTVRTMLVDALARDFFARHPSGLAVALLPGRCTRFSRIDNGTLRWVDLEPAELVAFKRALFPTSERHVIARCCSVGRSGWMKQLRAVEMPLLLVAEGGFRRSAPDVRDGFFTHAAEHLPARTELVIDYDAEAPVRPSALRSGSTALESVDGSGSWVTYPRIRFVRSSEHSERLAHDLAGVNAVSRLFRGRGVPSIAHMRFT